MKKISTIGILLAGAMFLVNCGNVASPKETTLPQEEIVKVQPEDNYDRSSMKAVITNYINGPITHKFSAHKIYGIEENEDQIIVYIYFASHSYSFRNGYFQATTGGDTAAVVELRKTNGEYEVVSFNEALTHDMIMQLLPEEYAKQALNEKNAKGLYEDISQQAITYLKQQGRTEKLKNY